MVTLVRPVILSGGSGTRLWPLSTPARPKQFAPLVGESTLFEITLSRVAAVSGVADPIAVVGSGHLALLDQLAVDIDIVLVEPQGRNTAPAIAAAALAANPDDILVILPSDHLISDVEAFVAAVDTAVDLAKGGHLVTFGIEPTRPETGYGYIEVGAPVGSARSLVRFKEKPELDQAKTMLGGDHLWNSGMFVVEAEAVLTEMRRLVPSLVEDVSEAMPASAGRVRVLGPGFGEVPKVSFDHAVMEHTELGVVVPLDVGWDDIGSYQALHQVSRKDEHGNATSGRVVVDGVSNSYVRAESKLVVVAGLSDVAVVETEDAILVVPLSMSQNVKDLAQRADEVEG